MASDMHVRRTGETYRVKDVTHKRRDPNRGQSEREFGEELAQDELAQEEHAESDQAGAGKGNRPQPPDKASRPSRATGPKPAPSDDEEHHALDVEI